MSPDTIIGPIVPTSGVVDREFCLFNRLLLYCGGGDGSICELCKAYYYGQFYVTLRTITDIIQQLAPYHEY